MTAMRTAYKVLAYLVAVGIVVQAVAMVWAVAGLGHWVDNGGVLDKAAMESEGTPFPEVTGFIVHGINGTFVVPVLALLLMVSSFFAKLHHGIRWAVAVFALTVIQGQLGFLGHEVPAVGAVHGLNALALFTATLYTATRVRPAQPAVSEAEQPATLSA